MARKSRKTRRGPTAPTESAAAETAATVPNGDEPAEVDAAEPRTPDIADAETLPAAPEDAAAQDAPRPDPADDTVLAAEPVADAEIVDAEGREGDDTIDAAPADPATDTVPPEDDPADIDDLRRLDGAEMEPAEDEAARPIGAEGADGVIVGEVRSDDAESAAAPVAPLPPATTDAPPRETRVVERGGPGFVPLLLGGLVAGAIGYAAALFTMPAAEPVDLSRIDDLEARIDALPPAADLSGLEAGQADLAARLDAATQRIDAEAQRVDVLESAPAADGDAPSREAQAIAALGSDIEALGAEVEALGGLEDRIDALPAPPPDLSETVAALQTELTRLAERVGALQVETEAVEDTAESRAREAAANQLRIAVDSGVPYAEPLTVLGGDVPGVLAENADGGLPTLQGLRDDWPAAARDALAEARIVAPDAEGVMGFLRRQTGARSLEPREGDDADAVLSRAEAALRQNDLAAALAEIEALPPEAREAEAMADWTARAATLAEARAALQDYSGTE